MRMLILSFLLLAGTAHAASFTFNQKNGQVNFEIIKFKIGAKVPGKFNEFQGTAEIDEKLAKLEKVNVTIQTASIDTAEEKRDNHLKSEDFFDAKKNSTITFVSTTPVSIKPSFDLPGKLTIKGVTKDVVLKMKRSETKINRWVFDGTTQVNRLDYGVSWNKDLEQSSWKNFFGKLGKAVLDDQVDIKIHIELQPQ